ncbi:MAG TPA: hypothetical protein VFC24_10425 [Casimicrobiaceae bacterium]|nr:hypothetical protein [Casimicrobiaceae bacterium]
MNAYVWPAGKVPPALSWPWYVNAVVCVSACAFMTADDISADAMNSESWVRFMISSSQNR